MSEIEKLQQYCEENDVKILGVTTAYELGLSDKRPTAEEIAAELNRTHEWLADPVNNLTSRIGGLVMLKKDTIMCLENRKQVIDEEPYFVPIPMTKEEEWKVRRLKEDVELFEKAVAMIKELAGK
jgi:vacuolar-type H+-ATPase subunit F/Vma7